jgi:isoleucyl-tRNA synthetase
VAAAAVAALGPDALHAFERGDSVGISVEGADHVLQPDDLTVLRRATGDYAVQEEGGVVVALDPRLTPELRQEGMARELVSRVQRMRKDAGLQVSDRIRLAMRGADEVEAAARAHREYVAGEVLARRLLVGIDEIGKAEPGTAGAADAFEPFNTWTQAFDLDGAEVHVTLSKDHP